MAIPDGSTEDLHRLWSPESSGVGVIDKTSALLAALETGPASSQELALRSGLPRATANRLALALERVRLIGRDLEGRFALGPRLWEMTARADRHVPWEVSDRFGLLQTAEPVLAELRSFTGASARLYRRLGSARVCVAAAEAGGFEAAPVPLGVALAMRSGPTAQVLLAWNRADRDKGQLPGRLRPSVLAAVRRRGWAQSISDGAAPIASLAAPVRGPAQHVVAALTVTGPVDRLSDDPGRRHGATLIDAAAAVGAGLLG